MKPQNSTDRKKKIIAFSILLLVTAGIGFLLLNSLWQKEGTVAVAKVVATKNNTQGLQSIKLTQYDELLQNKLDDLQQLDEQYTASITSDGNTKNLDSLNGTIHQQEGYFTAAVDSINHAVVVFDDENTKGKFVKMIAAFKSIITYRAAIGSLRNAVAIKSNGFSTDEKTMLKMQDELTAKNNKITLLENSIKTFEKPVPPPVISNDNSMALTENINNLESRIATLTSANTDLKKDNDRLLKQQTDISKTSSSNEILLKEKTSTLQQRIEMLNAEIQLTRVDCNIARVDATQIISNSRQRKQLLSDASSILTDLSSNGNADIKRKVKDKIIRLNQVAANTRD